MAWKLTCTPDIGYIKSFKDTRGHQRTGHYFQLNEEIGVFKIVLDITFFCVNEKAYNTFKCAIDIVRLALQVVRCKRKSSNSTVYNFHPNKAVSSKMNWDIEFAVKYNNDV